MPLEAVFAPDIHVYDAQGAYAPSPANDTLNAYSVGVGFTAVRAAF